VEQGVVLLQIQRGPTKCTDWCLAP